MSGYLKEPRATLFIRTGMHEAKKAWQEETTTLPRAPGPSPHVRWLGRSGTHPNHRASGGGPGAQTGYIPARRLPRAPGPPPEKVGWVPGDHRT